ncbi:ParB/RepB/Spo0J family partition protein [Faecalibacillus intestinalis]|uniref:ParB/RepB/Spo0J family partition protein n=1 Tax=Faecalibacillus intestinalis TaxID=1982626 RepID=UPI00295EB15A
MQQTGATEIDAIIRDLDDDQATLIMVDSNIQRENILPTERGFAYKMKLDAMKHQGKRIDLTSSQVGTKSKRAGDQLAEQVGESRNQIQRYIRLTYLVKPLRDMVDGISENDFKIALNPAYELSFLKLDEQNDLVQCIQNTYFTPSLAQSQELKRLSQSNNLNKDMIYKMLLIINPNNQISNLDFLLKDYNTAKGQSLDKDIGNTETKSHCVCTKILRQKLMKYQ